MRCRHENRGLVWVIGTIAGLLAESPADAAAIDGSGLSAAWGLPFIGLLLSIALGPVLFARMWHVHYGKVAALWSALVVLALAARVGFAATTAQLAHVMLADYLPFIAILFALYTTAGGLVVRGNLQGSPAVNTAFLALGTVLANLIGTTGAAIVLIAPLLRANDTRPRRSHVVIFFIILVGNIGGLLLPIGPPLVLGLLHGVPFLWPLENLWGPGLVLVAPLLAMFFAVDVWFYRRDGVRLPDATPNSRLGLAGLANLPLIAGALVIVAASAAWAGPDVPVLGADIPLLGIVRDSLLVGIGLASLRLTPQALRVENGFAWEPLREVAKVFAAIFVTMMPVLAMLDAGPDGAFGSGLTLLTRADGSPNNAVFFWASGLLSSLLDNAPTYLVFFKLAGGDTTVWTGAAARTLAALSLGAVAMGGLTYIGNAPNFMIYAIARRAGVRMPGFGAYIVWSGLCLLPIFALVTFLFFA